MSENITARRTDIEMSFEGTDISAEIAKYFLAMSYTDNEEDETDDLQISLQDRDELWAEKWLNEAVDAAASGSSSGSAAAIYRVTAKSGLNVRTGPGTSYKKLGALPYGAEIEVSGISDGWATTEYSGQTAYVCATYIEKVSAAGGIPATTTGLSIKAAIIRRNWNGDGKDERCECGTFELDSVDYDGPPAVITLRATSLSFSSRIRQTDKSKSWECYNLSGIAAEMARGAGMDMMFLSERNPYYEREEQYKESDIAFLKRLCHDAGISLKTCDNSLVLFDQATYEAKEPQFTIEKKPRFRPDHTEDRDYIRWGLSVSTADTQYQSCRVSYNDPKTGKSIEGIAKIPDYKDDDEKNQQLEVTAKVESVGEAEALAAKRLRLHNKYCRTAEFTLPGNPAIAAGVTVRLRGWGGWDGKYIVSQAVHNVDGGGYQTSVVLRRVLEGY